MFSTDFRYVKRSGKLSIAVVLGLVLLHFISHGQVLEDCVHTQSQQTHTEATAEPNWKAINTVITVCRPFALIMPAPVMREYAEICGLSDIEAFFFVQVLRSGGHLPEDLGMDIQYE